MNKHIIFEWCLEQAQKIVASYRAEMPEGFEVFNQVHNVTTPEQHRRTLLATMNNPNPRVREAAQAELDAMERDTLQAERSRQFGIQQAGLEESRQQRLETSRANRESRELYQRGLEDTRAERTGIAQEAQNARKAAGLQLAMSDPNLSKEERAAAKAAYLNTLGVQAAPNSAGAQKGAYGPGGAPATPAVGAPGGPPSPAVEAINRLNASKAGQPGGPNFPAVGTPGGPPASAGGYVPPTAAFSAGGAKPYVSPQDLSPGPGASPAAAERAFNLRQAVASGEATTGGGEPSGIGSSVERNVQQAVGGEATSAATYNPNVGANIVRTESGRQIAVGAPDASVGAFGMPVADYAATHGVQRPGANNVGFMTPSGGYIEGTLPKVAARIPASRTFAAPGVNPVPQERDMGGNLFRPPTPAFTTGGSAAQPAAQPGAVPTPTAPPGPINAPTKIQFGMAGQPPVDVASIAFTGGTSNQAQDVAARAAAPPITFGPGSNQAQDAAAQALAIKQIASKQPPLVPPPKKPNQG
jgi:hypothetical protein